jgi:hypothetical protein
MKIYVAEKCYRHTIIDLVSGHSGPYQSRIKGDLFHEVGTLSAADAILIPNDAYYFHSYPEYIDYIKDLSFHKLIIISDRGDFPKKLNLPNSIFLRVALDPGESHAGKILVPYNVESLENLPLRNRESIPKVSFMGYVPKISPKRILHAMTHSPLHPLTGNGAIVRNILRVQANNSQLGVDFTTRSEYSISDIDSDSMSKRRLEYIEQIQNSDFILTPRGDANSSARFYETLSAGRIPVFPFSHSKVPNDSLIKDSLSHMCVSFPLVRGSLFKEVTRFWQRLDSNVKYLTLQQSIRQLYIENFKYQPFLKRLFSQSVNELKKSANIY